MSVKRFVETCHDDFWLIPKWSFCYALLIFTIMSVTDVFGVI